MSAESLSGGADGVELSAALRRLDEAVVAGCGDREQWPARVAAGVNAALEFVVANPAAARALTDQLDVGSAGFERPYDRMVVHLAGMIRTEAPSDASRLPAATDEALVAGVSLIVAGYLRADRIERLLEIGPELIQMILLPYLGFAEAKRWSQAPFGEYRST